MFIYKVTFGDGSVKQIRANSPKLAYEQASIIGVVSHIKFVR